MKKIIFFFIIFRPLFSVLDAYVNFIGPITMAITSLIIIIFFYEYRISFYKWILITIFVGCLVISLINSENYSISIVDSAKALITILMLIFATEKSIVKSFLKFLLDQKKIIQIQIILIQFLLLISYYNPNSYTQLYNEKFFVGPFDQPHTLAYVLVSIILISIILSKVTLNNFYLLYAFIPIIFIFLTGARTPLIVVILFSIIFIKVKLKYIWPVLLIFTFFIKDILIENPIIKKFEATTNSNELLSGRTEFWKIDVNYFLNSDIFHMLFGNGIDFPYRLHLREYGMLIWSHNDFLHLLLSIGIIGAISYLLIMLSFFFEIFNKRKLFSGVILFLSVISLAFFNGLFIYSDFVMCFLVISALVLHRDYIE